MTQHNRIIRPAIIFVSAAPSSLSLSLSRNHILPDNIILPAARLRSLRITQTKSQPPFFMCDIRIILAAFYLVGWLLMLLFDIFL